MPPKKKSKKNSVQPRLLIIGGLFVLVMMVLLIKQDNKPPIKPVSNNSLTSSLTTGADAKKLPEEQVDQAIEDGRPVLAFFHSNSCVQCKQMVEIVDLVYPEFSSEIVLVDVNVYDETNNALLRRAQVRAIPTIVLIDRNGNGQLQVGVIQPEQLREQLAALSGGQVP